MFGTEDAPLSQQEMEAARQNARVRLVLWRKRGVYSVVALVFGCLVVYLFMAGSPLYAYWQSVGRYLMLFLMPLLLMFLYCMGLWWGAWQALRDLEKEQI